VHIWDVSSGKLLQVLNGHDDDVNSVCFSGDGLYVVSGSDDKSVKVWNAHSGKLLQNLKGHTGYVWSVHWSEDGRYLVSCSDGTVRMWCFCPAFHSISSASPPPSSGCDGNGFVERRLWWCSGSPLFAEAADFRGVHDLEERSRVLMKSKGALV